MIVHVFRLRPHDDLRRSLDAFVEARGIEAAVIVSCVGSLEVAAIRFATADGATILEGKFEITSLVGTLSARGGSHLHLTITDGEGVARGGHLMEGSRIYTTAEVAIGALPDLSFTRELDETSGYDELVVKPRES